jgi:biotin operon repressor
MQALRKGYTSHPAAGTVPIVPAKRTFAATEPTDLEVRERLRRWLVYFFTLAERRGATQKEFAEALGLSSVTISKARRGLEAPGLDMFVRMHFRLGADAREMMREDPPLLTANPHPEPQLHTLDLRRTKGTPGK